jgi:hypothetical protein
MIKSYYVESKQMILNKSESGSLTKLAKSYIEESGTATKRMDFVSFVVDDLDDNIRVSFGSGLNSKHPTKSPLVRNLKDTCKGDDDDVKGDE